jgi:hypothetical protein
MLDPDVEERLFLFLRMVKGWSLGARLTGKGVTAHVEGVLRGRTQSRDIGQTGSQNGDSRMSLLISAMMSSSGPWIC